MMITKIDPFSGEENTLDIPVTQAQMDLWQSGIVIQHAMPNLTPDQREFIMTGITADSWNNLFNG
jgi:hypothetical protein